ncbi:hypothetical protein PINS_up012381 [Pythium insidiosum]|nr:hypothetical protein PINS_up012381 [Pythium insidiosum]
MELAAWTSTVATIRHLDRVRRLTERCGRAENLMALLALLSVAVVMVESELLWSEVYASSTTARLVLKTVLSVVTAALLLALLVRYMLLCELHVETSRLPPHTKFFHRSSRLLGWFLLETVVCAFHIPAFVPRSIRLIAHSHVDQLDALVLLRVYLLSRLLRNVAGVQSFSQHVHVVHSFHRVDVASVWFTIKFLFQRRPLLFTCVALGLDWLLTSIALNFLERGVNDRLMNANDAVWLTIVTMTSVGYGEIAPETLGGKLAISLGAIAGGTILLCLLRVVLINALLISPQETLVLDVVRFHEYMRQRKQLAAVLVQRSVRLWRLRRSDAPARKIKRARVGVYETAEAFRLLRFAQPPPTRDANSSALAGFSVAPVATSAATTSQSWETLLETFEHDLAERQELMLLRVHEVSQVMKDVALSTT